MQKRERKKGERGRRKRRSREDEVDGKAATKEKKNSSPSMTIALPPLVPISMPRYNGPESIAEARGATERLAGCELGREVDGLIDDVDVVLDAALVFFFFAPRASLPRLPLLLPEQQQQ